MDLLIHVGLHKTGTTALQEALNRNYASLLKSNILYPRTGLFVSQHALIPGALFPTHDTLDSVSRSTDPKYYLDLLGQEVKRHNPVLTVISSEVFTEVSWDKNGCLGIIEDISRPFDNVNILLTLRDAEQQALSSVCHVLRENTPGHRENPILLYSNMIKCFRLWYDFWHRSGLSVTDRWLEDSGANLVDYYIGDFVSRASLKARGLLSRSAVNPARKELRSNANPYTPLPYLVAFLLGNSTISPAIFRQVVFQDIVRECDRFRGAAAIAQQVTAASLLGYLNAFSQGDHADVCDKPLHISLELKIRAMTAGGLDSDAITQIIAIANSLAQNYI